MEQSEKDELLEQATRIAERPIQGNGHSTETRIKTECANETARMIRELKSPRIKRTRRLK